jgi:hypothetical protein
MQMLLRCPYGSSSWGRCYYHGIWLQLAASLYTLALAMFHMTIKPNIILPSPILWRSMQSVTVKELHRWFTLNGLSLSPGKSEATIIGKIDTVAVGDVKFLLSQLLQVWMLPLLIYYLPTSILLTYAKHCTTISVFCVISGII